MDDGTIVVGYGESDRGVGLQLAAELRKLGYSTWTFDEHTVPWKGNLNAVVRAATAVVLIISEREEGARRLAALAGEANVASKVGMQVLTGPSVRPFLGLAQVSFRSNLKELAWCVAHIIKFPQDGFSMESLHWRILKGLPPKPDGPDIFLSYAHEDLERAKGIARALERCGWRVWWDRALAAGDRFRDVIEQQLAQAQCAVVLWSTSSVGRDFVRDEADEARKREVLVQAIIDPVRPPLGFRQPHLADLTKWDGDVDSENFLVLRTGVSRLIPVALNTAKPNQQS